MAIRDQAAKELAEAMLGVYRDRGYATQAMVDQAAALIQKAVACDELAQDLEQRQRVPA